MNKVSERLQSILVILNMTQAEFAKSLGITQAAISRQLNGNRKIDNPTILAIQAIHGISSDWLITGEGEMFLRDIPSGAAPESSRRDRIIEALPEVEREEIDAYIEYRAQRAGIDTSKIKDASEVYGSDESDHPITKIPLIDRIAAGRPIPIETNIERFLDIKEDFLPRSKKPLFALTARGDSMTGVGILNGDIVILEKIVSLRDEVRQGDIVAALIDGEATLKRIFYTDKSAELRAENPDYDPIPIRARDFALVQGKLVLVLRKIEE